MGKSLGEGKASVRAGDGALALDVTLNLQLTCCVAFAKSRPLWALVSPLVNESSGLRSLRCSQHRVSLCLKTFAVGDIYKDLSRR